MNVSTDALRTVKDALGTFKTDIEGIENTASAHSQACLKNCQGKIQETSERIKQLEIQAEQLTQKIQQLEEKINSSLEQKESIEQRIPQMEYRIEGLHIDKWFNML